MNEFGYKMCFFFCFDFAGLNWLLNMAIVRQNDRNEFVLCLAKVIMSNDKLVAFFGLKVLCCIKSNNPFYVFMESND